MKVGTIQEMTGEGYEILVDQETRSFVLAKFFDGKFIECLASPSETASSESSNEPTKVPNFAS